MKNIPNELKQVPQWILWRYEKLTKVPYQINGWRASSTDPSTWSSYKDVMDTYLNNKDFYDGIGFVFTANDPYIMLDFDHCIDANGKINSWVVSFLKRIDTYTEISPSGKGIRAIARGKMPAWMKNQNNMEELGFKKFEIYEDKRFGTITGKELLDYE